MQGQIHPSDLQFGLPLRHMSMRVILTYRSDDRCPEIHQSNDTSLSGFTLTYWDNRGVPR